MRCAPDHQLSTASSLALQHAGTSPASVDSAFADPFTYTEHQPTSYPSCQPIPTSAHPARAVNNAADQFFLRPPVLSKPAPRFFPALADQQESPLSPMTDDEVIVGVSRVLECIMRQDQVCGMFVFA